MQALGDCSRNSGIGFQTPDEMNSGSSRVADVDLEVEVGVAADERGAVVEADIRDELKQNADAVESWKTVKAHVLGRKRAE